MADSSPEVCPSETSAADAAAANGAYTSSNHQKYTSGNRFYHWHLRQFMHALYEMLASTGPRTVLDAGCGEGFVTHFLAQQNAGWELTGLDLSEEAVGYAQHHFGGDARFLAGDLYALPFADDHFDTVVCSEVLEHLDRPGAAARELRRVARSAVVVTVPREPYFRWLNDLGRALGLSPDPGHVNFWDERGFRRFIRRHLRAPRFSCKHTYQLAAGHAG